MSDRKFKLVPHPDGMEPSTLTGADAFTSDDRTELNKTFFTTGDEKILSGVWECAPCREDIDSYPVHEMMTISVSESVTVSTCERID